MREHSPAYLGVPVWGAFPTAPLPLSAGLLGPGPVAAFPLPTCGTQALEGCVSVRTVATLLTLGTSSPYTQGPSIPTRHPAAAPLLHVSSPQAEQLRCTASSVGP